MYLWAAGGWRAPEQAHLLGVHRTATAAFCLLGALLILRPWRACLRLEPGAIVYSDGLMPRGRYPLELIAGVQDDGGRHIALQLKNGQRRYIEYIFQERTDFLRRLEARGLPVSAGRPPQPCGEGSARS